MSSVVYANKPGTVGQGILISPSGLSDILPHSLPSELSKSENPISLFQYSEKCLMVMMLQGKSLL